MPSLQVPYLQLVLEPLRNVGGVVVPIAIVDVEHVDCERYETAPNHSPPKPVRLTCTHTWFSAEKKEKRKKVPPFLFSRWMVRSNVPEILEPGRPVSIAQSSA